MSDIVLGTEFAGYRIDEVVGRGGMGVVYRAFDLSLNRPVAIKLIAGETAEDADLRERFKREARLMAAIDHPNVIPVYAAGEEDGQLYLVMRYVDGTDLRRLLGKRGHLSAAESVRIVDQVGRALDAAHQRGLVHRDIKPANVLLDGEHVYLSDFGITRLIDERTRFTDSGKWVGTLNYMSPEHLRGEATDGLSDVYSLACLLFTCLTGAPPFDRESPAATITAQLHDRPPKASQVKGVPKALDAVVARGLAKRPKDRYRSAGALVSAALAAVEGSAGPRLLRGRAPRRGAQAVDGAASAGTQPRTPAPVRAPERAAPLPAPQSAAPPPAPESAAPPAAQAASERRTVVMGDGQPSPDATLVAPAPTVIRDIPEPGARGRGRRAANSRAGLWALLALVIAAVVAVVLVASHGSSESGPLTASEINSAVHQFAADYSARDTRALGRLLTADVTRVDPTVVEHGRKAVVAEYQQQFRTKPVPAGYVLSDLSEIPGWAGRASGHYTLTLKGGGSISGAVVFGLERVGDAARIGLIATR